jgi:hypothetical protein
MDLRRTEESNARFVSVGGSGGRAKNKIGKEWIGIYIKVYMF